MTYYAQTYLQLHHQIRRLGYSEQDAQYLRTVYGFGMQAFSGKVQGYGKSFLSHGVGTASVLANLNASIEVVAAGLVHNVYDVADFGDGQTGSIPEHQEVVLRAVGLKTEAYLATFNSFGWNPDLFTTIRDQLTEFDQVQRIAVLLHLADHLEHNLDHGTLYFYEDESLFRRKNHHVLVEMALILGYPLLGNEIQRLHQEHVGAQIPNDFKPLHKPAKRRSLMPKSCQRNYALQLKRGVSCCQKWLQKISGQLREGKFQRLITIRNWFLPF